MSTEGNSTWLSDDDQLFDRLREAVRSTGSVPDDVVAFAKAAIELRDLDAELAALTYDSLHDPELAGAYRSATMSVRSLVFGVGEVTLDVDVLTDSFVGQLAPPMAGTVTVETPAGEVRRGEIDELGMFSLPRCPPGDVRFRVEPADGAPITTEWTRL